MTKEIGLMTVTLTVNLRDTEVELKSIRCTSLDDVVKSAALLYPELESLAIAVSFPHHWSPPRGRAYVEKSAQQRAEDEKWSSL